MKDTTQPIGPRLRSILEWTRLPSVDKLDLSSDGLKRLAHSESLSLVSDTCGILDRGFAERSAFFTYWLHETYGSRLSERERAEIITVNAHCLRHALGFAKDFGTIPLRQALRSVIQSEIEVELKGHI